MYRSILVPLDGSAFGEQALPFALSVARRASATLHVAHVHVLPAPMYYESIPSFENTIGPELREKARVHLEGIGTGLRQTTDVPLTSAFLEGVVTDELHRYAIDHPIDLIVVTTHGRGPLSRFWLGSVADELVRRVPMPLLLVRPQEKAADLTQEPVLRHLLIPLDGWAVAEQILEPAVALGQLMDADYTLLLVVPPTPIIPFEPAAYAMAADQPATETLRKEAQDYLERVLEGLLRGRSLRVEARVAIGPQPAAAILEACRGVKPDLIAQETHGRRGLSRLFLGSVADKVIRGAATPVLVHRPITK